jgi:hypothetical protein
MFDLWLNHCQHYAQKVRNPIVAVAPHYRAQELWAKAQLQTFGLKPNYEPV